MTLILLIDDEPAITESLAYALERAGIDSVTASTLGQANERLREAPVDLIVLDLVLPDGNGLDWLRAFRASHTIPVIILSSHDDSVDHIVGLELGADDYIGKPFSPREVIARIRAVLRRIAIEGERTLPGGLALDADKRQVHFNGQRIDVSRIEFDLLKLLSEYPGRVYERDQILVRVWGHDVSISVRTIDVHVKSLRKKLVLAGLPAETIETVRGLGYRLAEG